MPTLSAPALKGSTLTAAEFRSAESLEALMAAAAAHPGVVYGDVDLMTLGNKKIGAAGRFGATVLVSKTLAIHGCPGRTELCSKFCYAAGFHYRQAAGSAKGIGHVAHSLVLDDPNALYVAYARQIRRALRRGTVAVRVQEAGDIMSPEHADVFIKLALDFPSVTFWGYSRSFSIPAIAERLTVLNAILTDPARPARQKAGIRESLDDSRPVGTGAAPAAFVGSDENKPARAFKCPEQLGGPTCASCGLCWRVDLPVTFAKH